ncbi:MAG: hypothetical protein FJ399_08505 [Verrucomicrobia bacterium]|nr:hypothetical protein [Verrucomicrobiota bacterium]
MSFASLRLVGLGAAVFFAGFAAAQTSAPKAGPAEKPQKLVKVATLNSVEANREFQTNVQLVQAQRQAAIELSAAHEKETNPAKKKELKTQLDTLLARLNENNAQMRKTYGFSLDRNYTLVIETAHVYMFVTDEEAAKVEKAEAARKKK